MRVIAVINQKGGVGKTTTTLNLAHALAIKGYRVLAIDLDPQGQLELGFGINQRRKGIAEVLKGEVRIAEVTYPARERLDLIPAGLHLSEAEDILTQSGKRRGWRLKDSMAGLDYDYVLIDCAPSAGVLSINALFAADEVLIPVSSDYLALHGVSRMLNIFMHVEALLKKSFRKWLVLTRYQVRRRLAQEVSGKLQEYFSGQLLCTRIHECVALAESPSFGKTIFEYGQSKGADDYASLADDLIDGRTV